MVILLGGAWRRAVSSSRKIIFFSFKGLVVVGRQTSGIWGQMDERVLAKQSR